MTEEEIQNDAETIRILEMVDMTIKQQTGLIKYMHEELKQCIDPDTAIVAFMGWLTSRDEVAGPFSSHHEAGQAAELVKMFCEAQGWKASYERFELQIALLRKKYPD